MILQKCIFMVPGSFPNYIVHIGGILVQGTILNLTTVKKIIINKTVKIIMTTTVLKVTLIFLISAVFVSPISKYLFHLI